MKKQIILIILVAIAVIIAAFTITGTNTDEDTSSDAASLEMKNGTINSVVPDATVITLTKNGFEPSEVTVKAGETVTFKSTAGSHYWPASDLHPSHLVYSEFDPLIPIEPDESWSFVFTKVGVWEFHDHISPYYTGVITVTE